MSKGEPEYGWGGSIEVSEWWYSACWWAAVGRGAERWPVKGLNEGRAETNTRLAADEICVAVGVC